MLIDELKVLAATMIQSQLKKISRDDTISRVWVDGYKDATAEWYGELRVIIDRHEAILYKATQVKTEAQDDVD